MALKLKVALFSTFSGGFQNILSQLDVELPKQVQKDKLKQF